MLKHRIRPERDLAHLLPRVQMPGRYTGGEFGTYPGTGEGDLLVAVCFPDLYEIGMSNLAVKLLYRELNEIPGVRCERVFAPAPDFEELLRQGGYPLYTLESGTPLHRADVLGVSVGYELAMTSIFTVLESGGLPIYAEERDGSSPVVVAGGPAVSNPAPFMPFFDAVYLGEAEAVFVELVRQLRDAKRRGAGGDELRALCAESPSVLSPDGGERSRAVWQDFDAVRPGIYPVPNIDVVQDHGVVEIMRGCPNGCRFCHAGFFYRPFRQKSFAVIEEEVEFLVRRLGYREITLSSLSSGDYEGLGELVRRLHRRWGAEGVSFALPSLKVDSFTLPLLQEISRVRKSGLTFAVETPEPGWQWGINKEVPAEKVVRILREARQRGWNMAKFYFMIGLPPHLYGGREEEEADSIAAYLQQVRDQTGFKINVNVGTFIPKPHTPYQWSRQLSEERALERIKALRERFRKSPVKVSYHSPFISLLEGVISRGDGRAGELALDAYRRGARLDAWEEHLDREVWRQAMTAADWDVEEETCRERPTEEELPWDIADSRVEKGYLLRELEKSQAGEVTGACTFPCEHNCGVCRRGLRPFIGERAPAEESGQTVSASYEREGREESSPEGLWHVFRFAKEGKAVYLSHINVMNIFARALQRSGVKVEYTLGYNPKPRMEFAQPLALGIGSEAEIGRAKLLLSGQSSGEGSSVVSGEGAAGPSPPADLINRYMPEGIRLISLQPCSGRSRSGRGISLMPYFGGATYRLTALTEDAEEAERRIAGLRREAERAGLLSRGLVYPGESERELVFEVPAAGEGAYKLKEFIRGFSDFADFLASYRLQRTALWTRAGEELGKEPDSYLLLFTGSAASAEAASGSK